jgi:hypothetical protein
VAGVSVAPSAAEVEEAAASSELAAASEVVAASSEDDVSEAPSLAVEEAAGVSSLDEGVGVSPSPSLGTKFSNPGGPTEMFKSMTSPVSRSWTQPWMKTGLRAASSSVAVSSAGVSAACEADLLRRRASDFGVPSVFSLVSTSPTS